MKNIKLVVNNFASENNIYFNKKELKTILNLYARMVSDGFWKDYDLDISKNRISFNVYKRYSDSPLFKINKEIKNKKSEDIYSVLNSQGYIINKSRSLESLINLVNWKKFKLVQ